MNGELVKEIRNIVDSKKKISPLVRDRLILAAIADLYEKVEKQSEQIATLLIVYKSLKWIGAGVTAAFTALLAAFATGKAAITFKQ
jgi:hypothetical protein